MSHLFHCMACNKPFYALDSDVLVWFTVHQAHELEFDNKTCHIIDFNTRLIYSVIDWCQQNLNINFHLKIVNTQFIKAQNFLL